MIAIKKALLILLALAVPASAAHVVTREYQFFSAKSPLGGPRRVYMRITCKKGADGKAGVEGVAETTILDVFATSGVRGIISYDGSCPTPAEVLAHYEEELDLTAIQPVFRLSARAAAAHAITSPADGRMYLANLTGTNGRSQIDIINTGRLQLVTSIDLGDRLFGGLQLAFPMEGVFMR